jgi:uncharacterized protein (DUF2267 family)
MLKENNQTQVRLNISGHKTRQPLNFDKFAAEGNSFIYDVMDELSVSRNAAARITKCVLHAIRDRMPADDAIQFAQGLPMALKGVFIDQYDLSDAPVVIRSGTQFLDYICYKDGASGPSDFPTQQSVARALRGVFNVLEDYMDAGQIRQVKHIVGRGISEIIDGHPVGRNIHAAAY